MNKIIEYDLLLSTNNNNFIKQVNNKLKKGWTLYGNTFALEEEGYHTSVCQAMVKYEEKKKQNNKNDDIMLFKNKK